MQLKVLYILEDLTQSGTFNTIKGENISIIQTFKNDVTYLSHY